MIASATESPNFEPGRGIPPCIAIHNNTVSFMVEILDSKFLSQTKRHLIDRRVKLIPVDSRLSLSILNNFIVLSGLGIVLGRIGTKRTIWTHIWSFYLTFLGLFLGDGNFVQLRDSIFFIICTWDWIEGCWVWNLGRSSSICGVLGLRIFWLACWFVACFYYYAMWITWRI